MALHLYTGSPLVSLCSKCPILLPKASVGIAIWEESKGAFAKVGLHMFGSFGVFIGSKTLFTEGCFSRHVLALASDEAHYIHCETVSVEISCKV